MKRIEMIFRVTVLVDVETRRRDDGILMIDPVKFAQGIVTLAPVTMGDRNVVIGGKIVKDINIVNTEVSCVGVYEI